MVQTSDKVKEVFRAMIYTDAQGVEWRRGMDGWFRDLPETNSVYLRRHDVMAEVIDKENKHENN
jgi:hypothetical protein